MILDPMRDDRRTSNRHGNTRPQEKSKSGSTRSALQHTNGKNRIFQPRGNGNSFSNEIPVDNDNNNPEDDYIKRQKGPAPYVPAPPLFIYSTEDLGDSSSSSSDDGDATFFQNEDNIVLSPSDSNRAALVSSDPIAHRDTVNLNTVAEKPGKSSSLSSDSDTNSGVDDDTEKDKGSGQADSLSSGGGTKSNGHSDNNSKGKTQEKTTVLMDVVCYKTDDVLVVVAITCCLNFTFVLVIWGCVKWFSISGSNKEKEFQTL